jgi:NarL family two-component system response regulator LiaR
VDESVRLIVADDHRLVHGALRGLLEPEGFEIVGCVRNGSQVLPLVGRERPDAVLLEFDLPGLDGASLIKRLRESYPDVVPIVLSLDHRPSRVKEALEAGAHAYISKAIDPIELAGEIRRALAGPIDDAVGVPETLKREGVAAELTEREVDILRLVAQGNSNTQIGQILFVTEQTVKFHLTNTYRKIGVANRTEAAMFAHREGLIESDQLLEALA